MKLDLARARAALQAFDFHRLFIEELGWANYAGNPFEIRCDDHLCRLTPIAEQGGMVIYEAQSVGHDGITPSHIRKAVDREIAKRTFEHLIIFTDAARKRSVWLWTKRESGKPAAYREHAYHANQPGDSLLQRLDGLFFDLDDLDAQGHVPIIEVAQRAAKAFDVERVTKRFYESFKTEHERFLKFLQGIQNQGHRGWYASVMLNRLMFIYFIQKKGFLDGDPDYLSHKLAASQTRGKDRFYRQFLTKLFFEGFATEEKHRSAATNQLLGKVPYLNGGIFLKHQIEEENPDLDIPDAAFERLFAFFNRYRWHLDDRPYRRDDEINPDVLGYIFEKYINQKQMGAYYTKEDITDYICKNTIIPFLFDKLATFHPTAVNPLPITDIEPYIYPAVKHGVHLPLPPEIAAGLNPPGLKDPVPEVQSIHDIPTIRLRQAWNKPAPPEYALPTEIWREVIARRRRYHDICQRVGGPRSVVAEYPADATERVPPIQNINDFITLNLDITAYAQDFIRNITDPMVLRAFYFECLQKLSVLDPTCGSGAFLFAALNILEPLYELCLDKMEAFLEDKTNRVKFKDFADELARVERHPNRRYFIYKNIIVNNLYGVDIMAEAVEICKLRLFLKLVAEVDDPDRIEPLPDIDFNIRAGNTLVGYATLDEVQQSLFGRAVLDRIRQVDIQLRAYRNCQTEVGISAAALRKNKEHIRTLLAEIEDKLDRSLFSEYGAKDFNDWKRTHQPFHWFVEFNSILQSGGFDVIVGNPPYVEYKEVSEQYTLRDYDTLDCGNLYAFVWERCVGLSAQTGRAGMIVPVASVSTEGYASLQSLLRSSGTCIVSNFNDRPSKLFDGLEHIRLSIILLKKSAKDRRTFSTTYNKWQGVERDVLFQKLIFVETSGLNQRGAMAKIGTTSEAVILAKVCADKGLVSTHDGNGQHAIYYTRKLSHFVQILDFVPAMSDAQGNKRTPSELKELRFHEKQARDVFLAVLNSTHFYWLITVFSDCRNLNKREIGLVRFDLSRATESVTYKLCALSRDLMAEIRENSKTLTMTYKGLGTLKIQCTYPRLSKPLIDEIDCVLACHYGLTAEELDFVVNYDIKYRLGRAAAEEEDV